jgi:hypothetical protein
MTSPRWLRRFQLPLFGPGPSASGPSARSSSPFAGYGSAAPTAGQARGALDEIWQRLRCAGKAAAAERIPVEADPPLKLDLRNTRVPRRVQLIAARLWRGQTTNFRSPGGGFARPVGSRTAVAADARKRRSARASSCAFATFLRIPVASRAAMAER